MSNNFRRDMVMWWVLWAIILGAFLLFVCHGVAAERSGKWRDVRAQHLEREPYCAVCGCDDRDELQVHHVVLFSRRPELELATNNLITLCHSCHWWCGHGGQNWTNGVQDIRELAGDLGRVLYERRRARHLIMHSNLQSYVEMHGTNGGGR